MIELTGIAKRFGRLHVLRGVDLTVRRGRVTAIVGPNAAGKTTLIKMILGLTRPDAGVIRIDGRAIGDDPSYRARIGYMPQNARLPENLSAAELIAMLRDLRAPEQPPDRELIEQFELEAHLRKPLRVLSGGTRQKVNAVLAFLFQPELIVLDEPSAGLDPVSNTMLKDRILEERGRGQTIVLASHVMSELDELADDVVFLADGKVTYAGTTYGLKVETCQPNLERAIARMTIRGAA